MLYVMLVISLLTSGILGVLVFLLKKDNKTLRTHISNINMHHLSERMVLTAKMANKEVEASKTIKDLEERLERSHTSLSMVLGKEVGPFHDVSIEIDPDGVTYQLIQRKKEATKS